MAEQSGIAQHPKHFMAKTNDQMRLPGDTRLLRDIKIKEIPRWIAKRDFSPLGMFFSMKRFQWGLLTKYVFVTKKGGSLLAMGCIAYGLAAHFVARPALKLEMKRKYH